MRGKLILSGVLLTAAVAGGFWSPGHSPAPAGGDPAAAPIESRTAVPAIRPAVPESRPLPAAKTVVPQTPVRGLADRPDETATESAPAASADTDTGDAITASVNDDAAEETLYLTIVGDRTYASRGRVQDGPPSLTELRDGGPTASSTNVMAAAVTSPGSAPARSVEIGTQASAAGRPEANAGDRRPPTSTSRSQAGAPTSGAAAETAGPEPDANSPWQDDRPWPAAGCPWTLPEGTTQQQADTLGAQYGCRYLASCSFATGQCTFYYQGAS